MNIILPLVTFSNRWEEAILCLYVSSQMSCSLIILSTSISSSAQNQGNYTENCGCQDEQNSWFWWEVNAQPVSTAMPQPCFLRFDSFWSSPMCSIYLRKLKIHKNVIYLKSLKVGFSSTWTKNFQIYKMGFKEAEEPEIKLLTSNGSWRKQGSARKTSTSAPLTMLKFLTM